MCCLSVSFPLGIWKQEMTTPCVLVAGLLEIRVR